MRRRRERTVAPVARSRHPSRIFDPPPPPDVAQRYLRQFAPAEVIGRPDLFPRLTAAALFGAADAPLELDIGCATGEFTVELARRNPRRRYLGIERSAKPLYRAVAAADRLGLGNILFVKTDFRVLGPLLDPAAFSAVYYHFPPPYLNARHSRTGIFIPRHLAAVHTAMRPDAFISVMTDAARTCGLFIEVAAALPFFAVNTDGPFRLRLDDGLKSFHHRKWEEKGRIVYRMELYPAQAPGQAANAVARR